jgi:carbon starvation protein
MISFFALYKIDGKEAGQVLWQLFGATNQLLAGLALLVVAVYLIQRRRPAWPYLVPMVFMVAGTLVAMFIKLRQFLREGSVLLLLVGGAITLISLWLIAEAAWTLLRPGGRRSAALDIEG